jgi:hypothetical protein
MASEVVANPARRFTRDPVMKKISALCIALGISPALGSLLRMRIVGWLPTSKGRRALTKRITLATLMMLLGTISGQALADPNLSLKEAHRPVSNQQVPNRLHVFDQLRAQQAAESDAYRHHGGPKSND